MSEKSNTAICEDCMKITGSMAAFSRISSPRLRERVFQHCLATDLRCSGRKEGQKLRSEKGEDQTAGKIQSLSGNVHFRPGKGCYDSVRRGWGRRETRRI